MIGAQAVACLRHQVAELGRRGLHRRDAQFLEALDDGRVGHHLVQRRMQLVADVLGQAGRAGDAEVVLGDQHRQTQFDDAGHVRRQRRTGLGRDRQALDLPALHHRHVGGDDVDAHRDGAGDQVGGHRRTALVRDVRHLHLHRALGHLADDVADGAGSAAAEAVGRVGRGGLGQVLQRGRARLRVGHDQHRRHAQQRHVGELLDRVVGLLGHGEGADRQRRAVRQHQRVAVGRRAHHVHAAQRAAGTGLVVDDDRGAQRLAQRLGDDTRDDVAGAAGGKGDDDADRFVRVGGQRGRRGRGQQRGGGQRLAKRDVQTHEALQGWQVAGVDAMPMPERLVSCRGRWSSSTATPARARGSAATHRQCRSPAAPRPGRPARAAPRRAP